MILATGDAAAQTTAYRTTTGHELNLPPVASLDCAQLDVVLRKIDGTNYRRINGTRPGDPIDRALFEYEDAAAARLATRCGADRVQSLTEDDASHRWNFGH